MGIINTFFFHKTSSFSQIVYTYMYILILHRIRMNSIPYPIAEKNYGQHPKADAPGWVVKPSLRETKLPAKYAADLQMYRDDGAERSIA